MEANFAMAGAGRGIEPPQGFWPLRILSPLRLPILPSRKSDKKFETAFFGAVEAQLP
jgi:hypothetical protein